MHFNPSPLQTKSHLTVLLVRGGLCYAQWLERYVKLGKHWILCKVGQHTRRQRQLDGAQKKTKRISVRCALKWSGV